MHLIPHCLETQEVGGAKEAGSEGPLPFETAHVHETSAHSGSGLNAGGEADASFSSDLVLCEAKARCDAREGMSSRLPGLLEQSSPLFLGPSTSMGICWGSPLPGSALLAVQWHLPWCRWALPARIGYILPGFVLVGVPIEVRAAGWTDGQRC